MTLGVLTNLLGGMSLREALEYLRSIGVESLELGCGGYPGKAHCDPKVLLNDEKAFEEFKATIEEFGMPVKTLSVHGNPVHPDKEKAAAWRADFRDAVLLAEKLGVDTVVTFSGCPGDCPESKHPNWVTCPWPEDFLEILDYQWNEVLIPYWKEEAEFCKSHGLKHIAFEMHPGFCVYNPETLLRLRNAVGDIIGANFDP
ncbi:MAG: sugar phosphate isomerase/epimerase, partial [Clostridia bacterium]|nr:sugar phosphate isomerase/epimerase [Clostridia bacterium]